MSLSRAKYGEAIRGTTKPIAFPQHLGQCEPTEFFITVTMVV